MLQHLQELLILNWTHDGMAVTIGEELSDQATNAIFGLNCIANASLLFQTFLEIILLRQHVAISILEPQRKVAQNPKE